MESLEIIAKNTIVNKNLVDQLNSRLTQLKTEYVNWS